LIENLLSIKPDDLDQDLIESGLLDSLALVELLHGIEQEFAVELPLEDLDVDLLRSVRGIAAFLDNLRSVESGQGPPGEGPGARVPG
jgi:D-alanine--poly(phosphoribitol) ligase subunit 2